MNARDADHNLIGRPTDAERAQGARLRQLAAEFEHHADAHDERTGDSWRRAAATAVAAAQHLDGNEDEKIRIPLTSDQAGALEFYMNITLDRASTAEKWRRGITYLDRGVDPATGENYIDLVSHHKFHALDVAEAIDWARHVVTDGTLVILEAVQAAIWRHHRAAVGLGHG